MDAAKKLKLICKEACNAGESVSDPAKKTTDKLTAIFSDLDVADKDGCEQPSLWRGPECDSLQQGSSGIPQQSLNRKSEVSDQSPAPLCPRSQIFAPSLSQFRGVVNLTDDAFLETLPSCASSLVEIVNLCDCLRITDVSVELVTRLFPNARYLDISGCSQLTDTALLHIAARLRRLQHLNLSCVQRISPRGIGYLAGHVDRHDAEALKLLQQLKESVGHADDDTDGHHHLTHLPIDNLSLAGCNLKTDEALPHLSRMTELRNLDLSFSVRLTDEEIGQLTTLPKLIRLHLYSCLNIGNDGLAHLARMPGLLALNLSECTRITFDGIQTLVQSEHKMTSLDITGCFKLKSNTLDQIAGGLLELRSLELDDYHTTDASLDSVGLKLPLLTDFQVRGKEGSFDKSSRTWQRHPLPRDVGLDNRSGQQKRIDELI